MHTGANADREDFPITFCDWLKRRRRALDLTQDELAQRAGCSVFALRKIESGERRPSKQLAGLLARALEVAPQDQAAFVRAARGELNLERLHPPAHALHAPGAPPGAGTAPSAGAAACATQAPLAPRLPRPATPLIGRERELAALERFFADRDCRLLTLTGPGGIGKTRLALEFAACQGVLFPGGVYYVPLAALDPSEHIVPAMASALGFAFSGPSDLKEQFFNYLDGHTGGPVLLALDNLEHLLAQPSPGGGEAAEDTPVIVALIDEILQRLPQVKILATSRERLNLHGEWTYELHGLSAPPKEYAGRPEAYPAAALFLQSARRARTEYKIDASQEAALARICQMLEGVPLAIELAAAWVGVLAVDEIAAEIQANMNFLTTTLRGVPERHRSMRASFEHSWKLLREEERQALMRLSVFPGGCDRASVQQVAEAGLAVLAALVSKSLVRRTESGRYDMHEVIRQFAFDHFGEDPGFQALQDRHAVYYLTFMKERERALKSAAQQAAFRELGEERENLRRAWPWAVERKMFPLLEGAVRSLAWCMETGWMLDEGIGHIELFVQALQSGPQSRDRQRALGWALAQQGLLIFHKGQFDRASRILERSLELLRPFGDPALLVDALINLAIMHHSNGEIDRAQPLLDEAWACAQSCGDAWYIAFAGFNLGYVASLRGQHAEGYRQMLDGLALWRRLGDPRAIAMGASYISPTAVKLERYAEAEAFLDESLALCVQSHDRWGMGTAYRFLGLAKLAQGRYGEAQVCLGISLEIFHACVTGWDIACALVYLGEAALGLGDFRQAGESYREGLRIAHESGAVALALDALEGLANLESRGGDDALAFRLACAVAQHPASSTETKERACYLRAVLEAQYPAAQARQKRQEAGGETLERLVEEVLGAPRVKGTERSRGEGG